MGLEPDLRSDQRGLHTAQGFNQVCWQTVGKGMTKRRREASAEQMKAPDLRRLSKISISLAYYLVTSVARSVLRLAGRPAAERLTILYYHGVPASCRSDFARQVAALNRGAIVVPAGFRGRLPASRGKKCVAVTFDDAFVSFAENGIPELEKFAFPSTVFVPVAWMGQTPGWELEAALPGSAEQAELSEVVMSSAQLRALSPNVSLGSHTMTHPHLPQLGPESVREEIERSRVELARSSGREIDELSFPYGEHDASTVVACQTAGYTTVYSIIPEEVDTMRPKLVRGRTKIDLSDGPIEFFLKYHGSYEWMRHKARLSKALLPRK